MTTETTMPPERVNEAKSWAAVQSSAWLDRIFCGDAQIILFDFPDESIDLVVTSPPYDQQRQYGTVGGVWWNFEAIADQLVRVLKLRGVIVWVVADQTIGGSETGTSMRQALYFMRSMNLHDTMIYQRRTIPLTSNRYQPEWEYMFVFSKGSPKTFNPLMEKSNLGRPGITCEKAKRGTDGIPKLRHKRALPKELKVRSNVWEYNPTPGQHQDPAKWEHPATFPDLLASDHIQSWSNPGDVVLDPFAGSGTTLQAAKLLNRRYVGIEVNPQYVKIIKNRLAQEVLALA